MESTATTEAAATASEPSTTEAAPTEAAGTADAGESVIALHACCTSVLDAAERAVTLGRLTR